MDAEKSLATFGGRLYSARKAKESRELRTITQATIGDALGVSQGTVNRWELDLKQPQTLELLERLAAWLGVRPGWLAFGQGPRELEAAPPAADKKPTRGVVYSERDQETHVPPPRHGRRTRDAG